MRKLLRSLLCSFALLLPAVAAAEEPPALKPMQLTFSSAAVDLTAKVPNGWRKPDVQPKGRTPVIGQFISPDGTATVTVRRLETMPLTAKERVIKACEFYAQYGKTVLEPVELSDGTALCEVRTDNGDRLRIYVRKLGRTDEVQVLVIGLSYKGTPKRNLRNMGKIIDSLRVDEQPSK